MSLNWDITKCADPDHLQSEEQWPITNAMIMATMFTGIGKITEDTVGEFHARLVLGRYWQREPLPYAEVRKYIGLTTNVFPQETRAKWLKRVVGQQMDAEVATAKRKEREGTWSDHPMMKQEADA
jgi:hypothetical protein